LESVTFIILDRPGIVVISGLASAGIPVPHIPRYVGARFRRQEEARSHVSCPGCNSREYRADERLQP
jgi:hypothetical protein